MRYSTVIGKINLLNFPVVELRNFVVAVFYDLNYSMVLYVCSAVFYDFTL